MFLFPISTKPFSGFMLWSNVRKFDLRGRDMPIVLFIKAPLFCHAMDVYLLKGRVTSREPAQETIGLHGQERAGG
ncbi:hypothetical protein [Kushneria sinocarnis]|uniref:hypothetical protein n=1 Tax=Kushneria sinocarnis TaxID=595502 RepID=UPI0011C45F61|nr:hypothetical protein [Kushneria sinocarnis]